MIRFALSVLLAVSLALTGCQQQSEQTSENPDYPSGPIAMTAGANPGSGFDITIRAVVEALQSEQLVDAPLPVENRPGNSGADFLATMVEQYKGKDDEVSVTSLSMMMNELLGKSKYGYDDVTMIARLITEYYVVVTRHDSPYNNLGDVMSGIKADPKSVVVGAANDDQAPFDLLVAAAGGNTSTIGRARQNAGITDVATDREGQAVHHDLHDRRGVSHLLGGDPGRRQTGTCAVASSSASGSSS